MKRAYMSSSKLPTNHHITYHVGLKILLRKKDEFLFLRPPFGSCFDLPGGRIGLEEKLTPLASILQREIKEELGEGIRYHLKTPIFHFRRYFSKLNLNVFLCVYEADFLEGSIVLSAEHQSYEWINPREFLFKPDHFLSIEEYTVFKNYLKTIPQHGKKESAYQA